MDYKLQVLLSQSNYVIKMEKNILPIVFVFTFQLRENLPKSNTSPVGNKIDLDLLQICRNRKCIIIFLVFLN